jgi:RES domain-containing protein
MLLPVRPYLYSDIERKHQSIHAEWRQKHARSFKTFLTFLTAYPTLGGLHFVGQQLTDAIKRAKVIMLEPKVWHRSRLYKDEWGNVLEAAAPQDFLWPPPDRINVPAHRWSNEGQAAMYLGDSPTTTTLEAQQDIKDPSDADKRTIWIARIQLVKPIRVVDVRIPFLDDNKFQPTRLQGIIYEGSLRQARNRSDKSNPQYRVTQYIADLVRRRRLDGIIYTSAQELSF